MYKPGAGGTLSKPHAGMCESQLLNATATVGDLSPAWQPSGQRPADARHVASCLDASAHLQKSRKLRLHPGYGQQ